MKDIATKKTVQKILSKYPNTEIVTVAVNEDGTTGSQQLLGIVDYQKNKLLRKNRPTVFLRADDRITKFDADCLNEGYRDKFSTKFTKEAGAIEVRSIKDVADKLAQYNKGLNDTTIVYCAQSKLSSDELN